MIISINKDLFGFINTLNYQSANDHSTCLNVQLYTLVNMKNEEQILEQL